MNGEQELSVNNTTHLWTGLWIPAARHAPICTISTPYRHDMADAQSAQPEE
jgi:hypothetical protein